MLIMHQMDVIKQVCDRVAVLDAGRVVEQGKVIDVFLQSHHDVTRALIGDVIAQELPLTIATAPFIARLVEIALREVDHGLIEAAWTMGATTGQIRAQGAAA